MNLKEHRKDFNKRWNISLLLDSPKEAFRKFKQRILNIFANTNQIDQVVTKKGSSDFCQYYSIEPKVSRRFLTGGPCQYYGITPKVSRLVSEGYYSVTIIDRLKNENNIQEFYRLIEVIFSLQFSDSRQKLSIIEQVKQAVEMSDLNVAVGESKGRIILYPKGEQKLDDELVNKTLLFLDLKSNKHFENGLKFYQNKKYKESAERLRQSVEEFLRHKLKNKKGLPENIKALQQTLKDNSQPEIRNIIFQVFTGLDKYFNEHSKHGDNVNEVENEFLIYQTGLLLRYINKTAPKTEQPEKQEV